MAQVGGGGGGGGTERQESESKRGGSYMGGCKMKFPTERREIGKNYATLIFSRNHQFGKRCGKRQVKNEP